MKMPVETLEWLLCAAVLGGVLGWGWLGTSKSRGTRFLFLLLLVVSSGVTFAYQRQLKTKRLEKIRFDSTIPRIGRPGGFVSSDTCQSCHPNQHKTWHDSYHRTMTQYVTPETVQADFNQVELTHDSETYKLWREGETFWAELPDIEWKALRSSPPERGVAPRIKRRLGLLTGSHHMQIFWIPSAVGNQQLIFPFAWLIADKRWAPVHATFLRDPNIPAQLHNWNMNCLKCHVTGGQPRPSNEIGGLDTRMGDIGISCEACHGPAEEHVRVNQNPLRRLQIQKSGKGDPTIVNPAKLSKEASAQVCGQCHGIKWIPTSESFAQDGFSYRPGQNLDSSTPLVRPVKWREQPFLQAGLKQNPRFIDEHYWPDGMVRVSGRDYNGTIEAPCYQKGEMTCLSCHSMHDPISPASQMAKGKTSNEACLQCHEKMRGFEETHSHHTKGSSGNECYNCHMPHTTYGLLKAIRSHQITSPTVASNLRTGRPNACNLCHLDKSLDWTATRLQEWYGQSKPPMPKEYIDTAASVVWALAGDAGQRALIAWHYGWEPAQQASKTEWLAPYLGTLLTDPYSAVRFIAHRSLKTVPGFNSLSYDFVSAPGSWTQARDRVLTQWRTGSTNRQANAALLISSQGDIEKQKLESFLSRRNHRSMDLQE